MQPSVTHNKSIRYHTIDIAKAFAIILVVIGHFQSQYMPHGYDVLHDLIYLFHMPLFIFASGFLYQATWRPVHYGSFIAKKFKRLMIPYFTTSLLIIALKLAVPGGMQLDHPVSWYSLIEMFYLPSAGYFLWFIWALWWMMVLIPLFRTPAARIALLLIAVPLHFCSHLLPEIFCLRQTADMLIFFSLGTVVADWMRLRNISSFSRPWHIISIAAFAIAATLALSHTATVAWQASALCFAANLSGIAMFITLSYYWQRIARGRLLRLTYSIAAYSYLIYLLHTTFEGTAKGVLFRFGWFELQPHLLTAWVGAAAVIMAGILIPWLLGRYVISRSRIQSLLFGLTQKK